MLSQIFHALPKQCRFIALNQKNFIVFIVLLVGAVFFLGQLARTGPGLRGADTDDDLPYGASLLQAHAHLLSDKPHPALEKLIKRYAFQPVRNEKGDLVNIVLVRSPFRSFSDNTVFDQYKDELLFLGISSFEDFPLPAPNPYSRKFAADEYVGRFPGFLNMYRDPERIFPQKVKTLLLSQSDFALPNFDGKESEVPKKYDFIFSGSDQDVADDCEGWSSYAKNWTFTKQALEVMCGKYNLTGVLVATKNKQGTKACTIPDACHGKVLQTTFLDQGKFFDYMKRSRFLFLPQVHDASPRVSTQGLTYNLPLFVNDNIIGGWKYLNEQTGEFFHDLTDFDQSLERLLTNIESGKYKPREYALDNLGDRIAGAKFKQFVEDNFGDRVKLPAGTRLLLPSGA